MPALQELQHSIETVLDLQSIVRTMKALAAASIRQYERALESLVDYNRTVEMGLYVILRDALASQHRQPSVKPGNVAAVVFGTDRGLCGRFNEDIADYTTDKLNGMHFHLEHRRVLTVGARVELRLEERRQPIDECFFLPASVTGITQTVQAILLKLEQWQHAEEVTHVYLFYHQHSRTHGRRPFMLNLLPLDLERIRQRLLQPWPSRSLPTYTMERAQLLSALVRQYLFVSLYRACAESLASEHASRLSSMQTAEHNIDEHLQEMEMLYRQQRQESITEELMDVVSGFEAIADSDEQTIG